MLGFRILLAEAIHIWEPSGKQSINFLVAEAVKAFVGSCIVCLGSESRQGIVNFIVAEAVNSI